MQTKIQKPLINDLVEAITQGIEAWQRAGEIVVKLMDEGGMTIEEISETSKFLAPAIIRRFEQLGRKRICAPLLVASYPASRPISSLSYADQERVLESGVEVLLPTPGGIEALVISPENLTPLQCRQVFAKGQIRSIAAQRAFIESEKTEAQIKGGMAEVEEPYRIRGKSVYISRPCSMTARQLATILSQIE